MKRRGADRGRKGERQADTRGVGWKRKMSDSRWKVLCLIDLDNQNSVLVNFTNK